MLTAASALVLGIPAAATASASTAGSGWLRLAHLSPNTPPVDVYLYNFGNPAARVVLHHVAYGTVSPYLAVTAGKETVAHRPVRGPPPPPPGLASAGVGVARRGPPAG